MSKLLVDEISDADNTGPVTVTDGLTVQGAFTSLGIDDNATSTAMTLDASGNLLVGKTSTGTTSIGAELNPTGYVVASCVSDFCGYFNRTTTDGGILSFKKDGTTVGSIGVDSNTRLYFTNSTGAGLFLSDGSQVEPMSNGTRTDDTMSLGGSVYRFKDLYLSGGAYLGGTAAANHLDDYEEGTFTLTLGGVAGGPFGLGKYVKVGRLVHFQWYSSGTFTATASSASFTGLPFITAPSSYYSVFSAFHNSYCATASGGYLDTNATSGVFINLGAVSAASTTVASGRYLMVAGTYYTDQ